MRKGVKYGAPTEQCGRFMLTGGRCELENGHKGQHQKTYTDDIYKWTDEDTTQEAERWSSRFD